MDGPTIVGPMPCLPVCRHMGAWRTVVLFGLGHALQARRCPICDRVERRWSQDAE